jgi:rhamnose utilization protein RhaD (predicted bifunctional aldolase and dehydrogenase)/NAD(P)-dependent dehydrogenase (short-subunit alcohol dehydrogenase family)
MVENRWNATDAENLAAAAGNDPADRQLALQVYASRLIGSDATLVQHGGGNTSCKLTRKDVFGDDIKVLHVKGSGRDLGQIDARTMPAVRLEQLLALRRLDRLSDQDMVNTVRCNMLDASGPLPSVEILLHAYLPHRFVNHTHATAMLALANLPDAAVTVREIFGDTLVTVPFHMPGFELAKAAAEIYEANPQAEGLLLLNHGHFAFSDDAKTTYDLIIRHTKMVEDWLRTKSGVTLKTPGKPTPDMQQEAREILPVLRGIIGDRHAEFAGNRDAAMPVMDLRAGPNVQQFFRRTDLTTLAGRGVATPDHVIRTKNYPLHLTEDVLQAGKEAIARAVDAYIGDYTAYFTRNAARSFGKKSMLNPAPCLAWIEGVGIVGMGADAKAAGIAGDLAEQNIAAMSMGADCGGFHPVGEAQLFDMEYWSLEQAKLGSNPPPALSGQVVLITGGGGAIGLATAQAFASLGANIFLVDLHETALQTALEALGEGHGGVALDITGKQAAEAATNACVSQFGGLDILVSNAGAAWTGEMTVLDDAVLRKSFELNFFAHQTFAKAAAHVFDAQNRGGQILFNVSKQAVNPGKGFGAYGIPKAATFFLLRQLALELGPKGVRVNGINADRIRSGLLDDAFIAQRAQARGIDEGTYMAGNLIRREVEASHVADAFVALALSARTTAHVMTVDGGNIEAALR